MTIHEIVQQTGLTKKAINYYEKKGLISPECDPDNGYRVFSEQDFKKLALIALLRQMDFPVEKIRPVVEGKISVTDLLNQRRHGIDAEIESLQTEQKLITAFLTKNRAKRLEDMTAEVIVEIKNNVEFNQYKRQNWVRSQWQRIFPGNLGRLFSLIYGTHLTEPLDTEEKRAAWSAFVKQLDRIEEVDIPDDIEQILESNMFEEQMHELEKHFSAAMQSVAESDKERVEKEMLASPPTAIEELPAEKIELVRMWLRISAFVRDELGERLAPLKQHLLVLSDSYRKAMANLSQMNEAMRERPDFQPVLALYERLQREARRL